MTNEDDSDDTKKTNNTIHLMITMKTLQSALTDMQTKILTKVSEDQAAAERKWNKEQAAVDAQHQSEQAEDQENSRKLLAVDCATGEACLNKERAG